jgi:hypothetical protein
MSMIISKLKSRKETVIIFALFVVFVIALCSSGFYTPPTDNTAFNYQEKEVLEVTQTADDCGGCGSKSINVVVAPLEDNSDKYTQEKINAEKTPSGTSFYVDPGNTKTELKPNTGAGETPDAPSGGGEGPGC